MMNKLNELVEYSDEVGEDYEYENWLRDDQDGEELSVMDFHVKKEGAADKAFELQHEAEEKLKELVLAGIEIGDRKFSEYPIGKVNWDKKIGKLMDYIDESFETIYSPDDRDLA